MNKKYVIGVDFGTLSGRAVVIDASNGDMVSQSVLDYPHAVMDEYIPDSDKRLPQDWALEHPQDYLDVLGTTIPDAIKKGGIDACDVIGLGIDFTACTCLPVYSDGTPLCFDEKYKSNPHAYVKLWKHHAAQKHANLLNEAAARSGEEWLGRYGGKISSEWLIPKIWQTLEEAPEIYNSADYFIEATDWVVWQLTGVQSRNSCTAGYKAIWNKKSGYPSPSFFASLDMRLENVVRDKLDCPVSPIGSKAGEITPAAASLTGLKVGTAIAVGNVDAHVAAPALGLSKCGAMMAIMGTSTCHMLLGDSEQIVPGMCGVVEDGILPGYFGYEAGQSCVGDHFAWFVENCLPASYKSEAEAAGMSAMQYIVKKASALRPAESGIIALDWWNGNRSILVDVDLTGLFIGMTLSSKPEELFRALVESTAFGTRRIIEAFRESGVAVDEFFAAGGIAEKDPFTMQIYADVIKMPIRISGSPQAPALGSAIFGAVAAGASKGGYDSVEQASAAMHKLSDRTYVPNTQASEVYDKLYAEYKILHDYFGCGGNDVMKRLKALKAENS
ncbi:MAG: ribulokinase [Eubacteriales bacterium]